MSATQTKLERCICVGQIYVIYACDKEDDVEHRRCVVHRPRQTGPGEKRHLNVPHFEVATHPVALADAVVFFSRRLSIGCV